MKKLKNDRILRALRRQTVDVTPVWMMRQAGRYLPEYRKIRKQAGSFMNLCTTPEYACEVTLQPIRRFAFDAAILFSDILTVPDAMGLGLHFSEGEGPRFKHPVQSIAAIDALTAPDPEQELRYVMDAIRLISRELQGDLPLLGFCGSPWTLATYMVEGSGSKEFAKIKRLMFDEPDATHRLLTVLADALVDYLSAQIVAGVDAVMIFDTWGGALTPRDYQIFSLAYMQSVVARVKAQHSNVPVTLFTKGGGQWLESIAATGCDAIGLDWTVDIAKARQRVGHTVTLQGNMDPCILYAKPERIEQEVATILAQFGKGEGHVFNLGHGIHPGINPEHVAAFVEAVHKNSAAYHAT